MKTRMPRRYDATVKTLKRLMNGKSEKVQLQASMRMSEILLTLEQSNERKEIAVERAQARIAEAQGDSTTETPAPESAKQESPEEAATRFLESLKQKGTYGHN